MSSRSSPWAIDFSLAEMRQAEPDDPCDRAYRVVIAALDEEFGPGDSSADVLQGVAEALCTLYIMLLDHRKVKSAEDGKAGLLDCMSLAYDMVLTVLDMKRDA